MLKDSNMGAEQRAFEDFYGSEFYHKLSPQDKALYRKYVKDLSSGRLHRKMNAEETEIYSVAIYTATELLPSFRDAFAVLRPYVDLSTSTAYVDKYARNGLSYWFFHYTANRHERATILIHESMHILYNHILRGEMVGGLQDNLNIPADLEINSVILRVPQTDISSGIIPKNFGFPLDKTMETYLPMYREYAKTKQAESEQILQDLMIEAKKLRANGQTLPEKMSRELANAIRGRKITRKTLKEAGRLSVESGSTLESVMGGKRQGVDVPARNQLTEDGLTIMDILFAQQMRGDADEVIQEVSREYKAQPDQVAAREEDARSVEQIVDESLREDNSDNDEFTDDSDDSGEQDDNPFGDPSDSGSPQDGDPNEQRGSDSNSSQSEGSDQQGDTTEGNSTTSGDESDQADAQQGNDSQNGQSSEQNQQNDDAEQSQGNTQSGQGDDSQQNDSEAENGSMSDKESEKADALADALARAQQDSQQGDDSQNGQPIDDGAAGETMSEDESAQADALADALARAQQGDTGESGDTMSGNEAGNANSAADQIAQGQQEGSGQSAKQPGSGANGSGTSDNRTISDDEANMADAMAAAVAAINGREGSGQSSDGNGESCSASTEERERGADDAGIERVSPAEQSIAKSSTLERVAEESRTRQAGNGSSDDFLRAILELMTPPKTPWQTIFKSVVSNIYGAFVRGNRVMNVARPNRRFYGGNGKVILPAYADILPTVAVGFDTSGSMGNSDYKAGLIEIDGMLKQVMKKRTKITFFPVDYDVKEIQQIRNIDDIQLQGGGGTDMSIAFKYMNELPAKERASIFILVTDGGTDWNAIVNQLHEKSATYKSVILVTDTGMFNNVPPELHRLATVLDISE